MGSEKKTSQGYFEQSKDTLNCLLFVLPLMIFYQIGLYLSDFQPMNGADIITPLLFRGFGVNGLLAFNIAIAITFIFTYLSLSKEDQFRISHIFLILFESLVYAFLMGIAIIFLLTKSGVDVPATNIWLEQLVESESFNKVLISVGAGVNEELFFRLFLFAGLLSIMVKHFEWGEMTSFILAALISGALFSAAHHIAEPFHLFNFLYRLLAGVVFAVIFKTRGFAVAVYTHTVYDLLVLFREQWAPFLQ